MEKKYKVEFLMDNTYQVVEVHYVGEYMYEADTRVVFQGSISDCEAYIRLKEGGYM